MTSEETITLTREEYDAILERNSQLEYALAARPADDGVRIPHEVAIRIMRGEAPIRAYRNYRGVTLRELSDESGVAAGYISEIERGRKPGSASALSRIARALGTSIDTLLIE